MKKITLIITAFTAITVIFSSSFAVNQSLVLSAESAARIAVQNSRQLVVDDLNIRTKENSLEAAMEDARTLPDAYGKGNVLSNKISSIPYNLSKNET